MDRLNFYDRVSSMTDTTLPFLQSPAWETFQQGLGRETLTKEGNGWSYLAVVEHGKLSNRLYCPAGPIVSDKKALKEALSDLRSEAMKRQLQFVRVEPRGAVTESDLKQLGLRRSHKDVQPSHTIVNNLENATDESIMAATSQTVRRIWRKNEKQGVSYEVSYNPSDVQSFIDMIHDVSLRTGMKPFSDTYFQTTAKTLFPTHDAGLIFAMLEGKRIAAILFYSNGQTMYYAHAASYSRFRDVSPATSLALYSLMFAAREGFKAYDFCGAAPEGAPASHTWAGFTAFKLSFGGERASTLGTWELPISKAKYAAYRGLITLSKRIRKH